MPRRQDPSKFEQNMQLVNTLMGLGNMGLGVYGDYKNRQMQGQRLEMDQEQLGFQRDEAGRRAKEWEYENSPLSPGELASLGLEGIDPSTPRSGLDELLQARNLGLDLQRWKRDNDPLSSQTGFSDLFAEGDVRRNLPGYLGSQVYGAYEGERGDYRQDDLMRGRMGLEDQYSRDRMDKEDEMRRAFSEWQANYPYDLGSNAGYGAALDAMREDAHRAYIDLGRVNEMGNPMMGPTSDDPREYDPRLKVWDYNLQRLGSIDAPSDESEWSRMRQIYPPGFSATDVEGLAQAFGQSQEGTPEQLKAIDRLRQILELEAAMQTMDPEFSWNLGIPEAMSQMSVADKQKHFLSTWKQRFAPDEMQPPAVNLADPRAFRSGDTTGASPDWRYR